MAKQIDAKLNYDGDSEEATIEALKKAVDDMLAPENKGKWGAEIQRDTFGKLIAVNVNLPDSVTDNEKANAVNAIGNAKGVASVSPYPMTIYEQDMEALPVGTQILPEFYVYSGTGILEGITTDQAHSGVQSFSFIATASVVHAYELEGTTVKNLLVETWVKTPTVASGELWIHLTAIPGYMSIRKNVTFGHYFRIGGFWYGDPSVTLQVPDSSKWYKFRTEIIGDNYLRCEVLDENENVILTKEGSITPQVAPSIRVRISTTEQFKTYVDDFKITQTAR